MDKLTVRDADVAGKRVFVRVDFNVPLADGRVTDDSRVRAAIPTINLLLSAGASVILASHLGRPDGKVQDGLRLRPVGQALSQLMRRNVGAARRTTPRGRIASRYWVYDRSGEPCLRCGGRVAMSRLGPLARSTYYCPECQSGPAPVR